MMKKKCLYYTVLLTLLGGAQVASATGTDATDTVISGSGNYNSIIISADANSNRYNATGDVDKKNGDLYGIYGAKGSIDVVMDGDRKITINDTGSSNNGYRTMVKGIANANVNASGGALDISITTSTTGGNTPNSGGIIQGIYASSAKSTTVTADSVNLVIDAKTNDVSDAGTSSTYLTAYGIQSEVEVRKTAGTNIAITGDVNIDIKVAAGNANATATGKFKSANAYAFSTGILAGHAISENKEQSKNTITGDVKIKIVGTGGTATSVSDTGSSRAHSEVSGIRKLGNGANEINGSVDIDVTAVGGSAKGNHQLNSSNGEASAYADARGIEVKHGELGGNTINGNAKIVVTAQAGAIQDDFKVKDNYAKAYGLYAADNGNTITGDIEIIAKAIGDADGNEFRAYSVYADWGINDLSSEGKNKKLEGDVRTSSGSTNTITLDTAGSYLQGNVIAEETYSGYGTGINDISVSNGAEWRPVYDNRYGTYWEEGVADTHVTTYKVTNNSIDTITLKNNGVINMNWDGDRTEYRNLTIGDLKGSGGIFLLSTDLASETNGDQINITTTEAGATHYITVKDISLTNSTPVGNDKKLLIAKDASGNAIFAGKELDTGGLWETTPTIEKIGSDWYLTNIKAAPNASSNNLLKGYEAGYGVWRSLLTDDSLRARSGGLSRNIADAGLWSRVKSGKLSGSGFDSSYQTYQLGVDKKIDNNIYGVAVDYSRGNSSYDIGSGKNSMFALSAYASNYRKDGVYSDIVLRAGRFNEEITGYGQYRDHSDYGTWGYSIGYEIGKNYTLNPNLPKEKGWSIEPQAQLVAGHFNGGAHITDRGIEIDREGVNTVLGRVGTTLSYQNDDGSVYLKANLLREFAGNDKMSLRSPNGEVMNYNGSYKDTWYELGLGGSVKLSKNSYFYGDVIRSFSAAIQKKWQFNAGFKVEF